jgi:hypothetical protein
VTPRTVVSWVEKARARGLLSAPPSRGATGGHLIAEPRLDDADADWLTGFVVDAAVLRPVGGQRAPASAYLECVQ